jgi:hypothetical protein
MSNFKQLDLTEFHHLRAQLDIKKDQVPHHNYYSGTAKTVQLFYIIKC